MAFIAGIDLDDVKLITDGSNVEKCPSGNAFVTRKSHEVRFTFNLIFGGTGGTSGTGSYPVVGA